MSKNILTQNAIIAFLILASGCSILNQTDCPDNLEPYFRKNITYKNNEIIEFINDSGIHKFDTVHIKYPNVPSKYLKDGNDQENYQCGGQFFVDLGDYEITGVQQDNEEDNTIYVSPYFFKNCYCHYLNSEAITYLYNGNAIDAIHYYNIDSTSIHNITKPYKVVKYCTEFYFTPNDFRLLAYSISDSGIITNWRIK
jgi:hypothetical protein